MSVTRFHCATDALTGILKLYLARWGHDAEKGMQRSGQRTASGARGLNSGIVRVHTGIVRMHGYTLYTHFIFSENCVCAGRLLKCLQSQRRFLCLVPRPRGLWSFESRCSDAGVLAWSKPVICVVGHNSKHGLMVPWDISLLLQVKYVCL